MLDKIGNPEKEMSTKLTLLRSEISNSVLEYHKANRNKVDASRTIAHDDSKVSQTHRRLSVAERIEEMVNKAKDPLSARDKKVNPEFLSRLNNSYRRCSDIATTLAEKDVVFKRNVHE